MPKKQSSQTVPKPIISGLPGSIDLLKEAFAIYKDRFITYLGILLIPTIVIAVLAFTFAALGVATFEASLNVDIITVFKSLSLAIAVIALVGFFIQSWGYLALIYAIKDRKENIGLQEAYKRSLYKLVSYWWVAFLSTVIVGLGFICLIIPGIIFLVWFGFAPFVLVNEGIGGFTALLQSKSYVSGRFFPIFFRLVAIAIIGLVLVIIGSSVSEGFGGPVVSLLFGPLAASYYFLLYERCKKTKVA